MSNIRILVKIRTTCRVNTGHFMLSFVTEKATVWLGCLLTRTTVRLESKIHVT